jgi:hypothetical protein
MAITAHFGADFAAFKTAVDQADLKLKGFQEDAAKVQASLNRVGDAFSGRKIIQDATLAAKAIEEIGGVSKLTASEAQRMNALFTEAAAKAKALGGGGAAAFRDLADATQQGSSWVQTLGKDILTTAAGFVTAQAVIAGIKTGVRAFADEVVYLTMHGSAVSDVTANFEHLAAQSGRLGSTLVGELRTGTHATISDFELIKLATQDLAAGLNLTDQQFGTLAKGAFALAQATGTDVKTALDTMNDAMLTGRTRALALLTGKIDLEKAETAFARSLNTTRDHLSEEGKLEAARVAILDAVSGATSRLGVQIDGLDERVQQAQAAWANFHNELSKVVAESPVLAAAFDAVSAELTNAFGVDKKDLIVRLAAEIDRLAIAMVDFAKIGVMALGDLYKTWLLFEQIIVNTQVDIANLRRLWILWQQAAMLASGDFANWERLEKQLKAIGAEMEGRHRDAAALTTQMNDADGVTGKWVRSLDEIQAKMRAAQAGHHDFGASMDALAVATSGAAKANTGLGATTGPTGSGLVKEGAAARGAAKDVKDFGDAMDRLIKQSEASGFTFAEVPKETKDFGSAMDALVESTSKGTFEFAKVTAQAADFGSAMEDLIQKAEASGFAMVDAGTKAGTGYVDGIKSATARIPDILIHAFTGGGGLLGAAKAIGVDLADAIVTPIIKKLAEAGKQAATLAIGAGGAGASAVGGAVGGGTGALVGGLASQIGGAAVAASGLGAAMTGAGIAGTVALGAMTFGIGAAAVGVVMLAKHFMGVSKAVKEVRAASDEFTKSLGGILTAQQQLEVATLVAAGNSAKWAQQIVGVRQAYLQAGASSEMAFSKAEEWSRKLFEAEKKGAGAVALVIAQLNAELAQMSDEARKATEETNQAAAAAKALADELDSAVKSWGGDDLFHQVELAATAIEKIGGITHLTADEQKRLADLLDKAIEKYKAMGQDVPPALLALLRGLNAIGVATDHITEATKKAITEMLKLRGFSGGSGGEGTSETRNESDLLKGLSPDEAKNAYLNVIANPGSTDQDWNRVKSQYGFHTGGVVLPFKIPRAHAGLAVDERMIIAQTGEGILSRRGMAALSRLNSGQADGGGINISIGSINCNATEAEIADAVISEMRRKGVRFRAA